MFNFIRRYIDKQVEKSIENNVTRIEKSNEKLINKIENGLAEGAERWISTLIERHHLHDSSFSRRLSQNIQDEIRSRFIYEFNTVREQNTDLNHYKKKIRQKSEELIKEQINDEDFIDGIVERIKRKQLS